MRHLQFHAVQLESIHVVLAFTSFHLSETHIILSLLILLSYCILYAYKLHNTTQSMSQRSRSRAPNEL